MSAFAEGTYTTKYPAARAHATAFASAADFPQPRRPSISREVPLQELPNLKVARAEKRRGGSRWRRTPPPGPPARPPASAAPLPPRRAPRTGRRPWRRKRAHRRRSAWPARTSCPPVRGQSPPAGAARHRRSSRSRGALRQRPRRDRRRDRPARRPLQPRRSPSRAESPHRPSRTPRASSLVSRASSADAASDRAPSAAAFSSPSLDPKPRTHAAVATGGATRATAEAVRAAARANMVGRGGASLDSVASLSRAPGRSDQARRGRGRYIPGDGEVDATRKSRTLEKYAADLRRTGGRVQTKRSHAARRRRIGSIAAGAAQEATRAPCSRLRVLRGDPRDPPGPTGPPGNAPGTRDARDLVSSSSSRIPSLH